MLRKRREGSRTGQREKSSCGTGSMTALADPMGSSGAGIAWVGQAFIFFHLFLTRSSVTLDEVFPATEVVLQGSDSGS